MKKNIFIVGINEFNLAELQSIENADDYNFRGILEVDEMQIDHPDILALIEKATRQLDNFDGSIDGIVCFFDFPVSMITYYLCEKYNCKGPSILSALKCEHKYWSRLEQKKVCEEYVPNFAAIDPHRINQLEEIDLKVPFWLKPVKSYSSILGFKINNQKVLNLALEEIKSGIGTFSEPFNYFLRRFPLPSEIQHIDGNFCIAEDLVQGSQCTVSGFVYEGKITIYGIVDSVNYENSSSFFYYQYPAEVPSAIKEKLYESSAKIIDHIGFDNSPFNIEFFYNKETGELHILEINPRMSQSHSDLYSKVNGSSNHQILVNIAVGHEPKYYEGHGNYNIAARFHHCLFEDGLVIKVPSEEEIREVKKDYPDAIIINEVQEGKKLSEGPEHDSYSYRLATIFLGADDKRGLMDKYNNLLNRLNYQVVKIES